MDFLDARGALVRHAHMDIGLAQGLGHAAAAPAGEGDHGHLAAMGGLDGGQHVGGVAAGGDGQQHVARAQAPQREVTRAEVVEPGLDPLDRAILRRLQADGRETYDQVGAEVGLSASAVLRRVRRLEEAGVIDRYVALVRPEAVGLGLTAYLNVRLEKLTERHKRNPMDVFRASVQAWPEVVECVALTGDMDYLLRVVVRDIQGYDQVYKRLIRSCELFDVSSSFAMERIKYATALPLPVDRADETGAG